jgi:hypothetical protein
LTKRDAEALLGTYDSDPVAALTAALRIVLERDSASWPELIQAGGFTETRTAALLLGELGTLDELAAELNERRGLA